MTGRAAEIRHATADDGDAIADVHVSAWRTTYAGIVDQAYIDALSVADRAAAWRRRLANPAPAAPDVLVAVDSNNHIVGFISGGEIREPVPGFDAELHAIYLLRSQQGMGLGRRLVRAWAALAIERGHRAAVVRVLAQNRAREFYRRLGADVIQESEHAVGDRSYPDVLYGWPDIRVLLHGPESILRDP
jgi:ribosomal protein S18 acetylase RimI-like enzyme